MRNNLLYHYSRIDLILDILESNELKTNYGFVSFTRDNCFHKRDIFYLSNKVDERNNKAFFKWKYPIFARLVLNKDLMRNNYKLLPVNIFYKFPFGELNSLKPIGEERCFRNLKHLDKYLITVDFNRLITDKFNNNKLDYYFIEEKDSEEHKGFYLLNKTPYQAVNLVLNKFKGLSFDDYFNLLADKGIQIDYF